MSRNIVLIGFMGSGKTTVGKKLAEELNFKFIDTDHLIEVREKMTINDIFKNYGEEYFRSVEKEVIKGVSNLSNCVISTGGGIVKYQENIIELKKNGILFYLKASPEKIYSNIRKDLDKRPLLKGSEDEKLDKIKVLLRERKELYKLASDYIINTDYLDIGKIVMEIKKLYMKI